MDWMHILSLVDSHEPRELCMVSVIETPNIQTETEEIDPTLAGTWRPVKDDEDFLHQVLARDSDDQAWGNYYEDYFYETPPVYSIDKDRADKNEKKKVL